MNAIRVGNRLVGTGQPCFLVAEIGNNRNGDFERTTRLVLLIDHQNLQNVVTMSNSDIVIWGSIGI
jgi:sialic acid synthase SpsE